MAVRQLLVEGPDDFHVLMALLKSHRIPEVFEVIDVGGIDALLDEVPVRLKAGVERLAFIIDADIDLKSRWESLRVRLQTAGCTDVPELPVGGGTILQTADGQKVGVWLMPDNQVPGILEHFVAFLVPEGDGLLARVDQFLDSIPEPERRFKPADRPKARIHTWLGIQADPGTPMGLAITKKYLQAGHQAVEPLLSWLRAVLVQ